jgi:uncharacterized protein YndB with AHSA1/START domain
MNNQTETLTKTIFLSANRDTVWSYLTEQEKLATWFNGPTTNIENGKAFTMMSSDDPTKKLCWGKVTEWVEPSKLAYEFSVFMMEDLTTHVTWQLEEIESGTKLTMVHTGLPADSNGIALSFALDAGWDKHFGSLRDLLKAA